MVSFEAVLFSEMLDPTTVRTRVRLVDPALEQFRIARAGTWSA
jgi:hypothetical protein